MASQFSQTTRALAHDGPRAAYVALAAAVAVLAALSLWFLFGRVTVYEVSRQARLESAATPRDVTTQQAGRLTTTELTVGREVQAGDVLVELDAASDALSASEAEARLSAFPTETEALRRELQAREDAMTQDRRASEASVQSATAHVQEATAAADFAQDNARRLRAQSVSGGVAEIEALHASMDAKKAAATRDGLSAEVQKLELEARMRASQSRAEVEALRRNLAAMQGEAGAAAQAASRLRLQVDRKVIRAPVGGVIAEALPLKPGAYVAEGQKVATIIPRGGLVVVAQLNPATALGRVRAGQTARLRLDGFSWAQYGVVQARVLRVSGEVRDNLLRVELEPIPERRATPWLRHGLSGVAEVDVEHLSPAVMLLRAAGQASGAQGGAS